MAEVFCGCSGGRLGKPGNIPYEEAEVIISSQHYAQSLEVGEFPKFLSQKRARARERERESCLGTLCFGKMKGSRFDYNMLTDFHDSF